MMISRTRLRTRRVVCSSLVLKRSESVRQHGLTQLTVRRDSANIGRVAFMESPMKQVTFTVPAEQRFRFLTDLDTWERLSGKDTRVTQFNAPNLTTNTASPLTYICQIDDTFFDQYPKWRDYLQSS
jgi:hypothetical protein